MTHTLRPALTLTLERHTALFRDPTNKQRRFIPLRLDDCEIKDSLSQFEYIDWRKEQEHEYQRLQMAIQRFDEGADASLSVSDDELVKLGVDTCRGIAEEIAVRELTKANN